MKRFMKVITTTLRYDEVKVINRETHRGGSHLFNNQVNKTQQAALH